MATSTATAAVPVGSPLHHVPLVDSPLFHLPSFLETKASQAIQDKAVTLSWKGAPEGGQRNDGSGVFQEYENCTIWATKSADGSWHAAEVHGAILIYHRSIGGGKAITGCPVTDEAWASDHRGRFNNFQNGAIYWTAETGAHEIYGNILKQWQALGAERSWLGYPLTGELGYHAGRLNSFEHGQIHWQSGATSTVEFRNTLTGKYNAVGGIFSQLGMPSNVSMPITRSGNNMLMSFRGGTITHPLNEPAPAAVVTQNLLIVWTGLECQVRQESNDELSGAISLVVPSTVQRPFVQKFGDQGGPWQLGHENERIMNTNVVLYNGPPANVIITTELVELDHSAGNPLAVTDKIAGVLEDGSEVLQTAGGLTGDDVLSGYGREVGTVADTYKRLEGNSIFQQIVAVFDSPDDPYPPGILNLDWVSLLTQVFITPNRIFHQSETSLSSICSDAMLLHSLNGSRS